MTRIIDLHSHVLPGVDDGAQDLEQAVAALEALYGEGVEIVVATPHFRGSLLERPARARPRLEAFDAAYDMLVSTAEGRGLGIRIERAVEFKLDVPHVDLADARLRLGGSRVALVEFASFQVPPFAGNQLRAVREAGWVPLLAHPERYLGSDRALDRIGSWIEEGTYLQVNARSLLGHHGAAARHTAVELLGRGWVCCLASDYHGRGGPEWVEVLSLLDGLTPPPGWIRDLVFENPRRLLADELPKPVRACDVAVLERGRRRLWR
jgi:protein-tyrosine phosphatase